MAQIKCNICACTLTKDKSQYIGKSVYCDVCYPKAQDEEKDRRHLIAVICEVFSIKKPTGMMFAQMKNYKADNISYKTMRLTLLYLDRVLNFKLDIKFGIGIIKTYHEEMTEYYNEKMKKRREIELVEYKTKTHIVNFRHRENKLLKNRMIDLNTIIEGGLPSGEE